MNRREIFQAAWPVLLRIAYRRTRDRVEAEDLTQDAMLAAFESRPEPDDLTSFVSLATSLMRRILYHKRRAAPLREDPTWTAAVAESSLGLRRTPEDIAALRECAARLLERLEEAVKDDPQCKAILAEIVAGNEAPADWAQALEVDIVTIRNARRRLARHVEAIAATEDRADVGLLGWEHNEREAEGDGEVES